MSWEKLGKTVAQLAPILGAVLPIPGGAAIGSIVASTFGGDPNDPEALEKIIKADPEAAVKLKQIEADHKVQLEEIITKRAIAEMQAETDRLSTVNKTMQIEAVSGDKWQRRWRPFWGFLSAIVFAVQMLIIGFVVITSPANAPTVITAFAALDIFWGVPLAILGITAYQRSKEKRALAGEQNGSRLAEIIQSIKKGG